MIDMPDELPPVVQDAELDDSVEQPKKRKWQPEYLKIVALSCLGKGAKEIALQVERSQSHVYQVLAMDEADEIRAQIMEKMRERTMEDLQKDIEYIKHKAVGRIKQIMDSDEVFEKNPFAVLDRGFRFLEGVSVLKSKESVTINNTQNNANFNLPADSATSLIAGLEKANEVRQLHGAVTNQSIDE